jgi:hypothetical protein
MVSKMIKVFIDFNTEDGDSGGSHDPAAVDRRVDEYMVGLIGFNKAGDGYYTGNGHAEDLIRAGYVSHQLSKLDWFAGNIRSWLLLNSDESDDPDDYHISDIRRTYFDTVSEVMLNDAAI